jgi:predicted dehydrogenase
MKFLQIGLGSMGKRRVRNLLALGHTDITGFDFREDRRQEAEQKYKIKTVGKLTDELVDAADAIVISTPPDKHLPYIELSVKHSKPCFVEASVILAGLPEVNKEAKKKNLLVAPSCTMRFHPSIKVITDLVKSGKYGKLTNFTYHSGQYLPDWHPWEKVTEFYVSKKETGACREIVPFELTWILDVVGKPEELFAYYAKTLDFGADIDDVYSVLLKFKDFIGTLVVDVTARVATRVLILNLENAQIRWDWNEKIVKVYDVKEARWVHYFDPEGKAAAGYDKNIIEEMYIQELGTFAGAAQKKNTYPNTLDDDIAILEMLEACEKTNRGIEIK